MIYMPVSTMISVNAVQKSIYRIYNRVVWRLQKSGELAVEAPIYKKILEHWCPWVFSGFAKKPI